MQKVTGAVEALAARYVAGRTLRQIGAEIGRSHTAVRYHLLKLPGYRALVTRMLLKRLRLAERAYNTTRAREHRRRLKHCLATLRQMRPAVYARLIARGSPRLPGAQRVGSEYRTDCPSCLLQRAVVARTQGGAWRWQCFKCGESGAVDAL